MFNWMKQFFSVILLLSAGFAIAQDANPDFDESIGIERAGLEEAARQMIEQIREKLKAGIPEMDIPPLDPLDLKYKEINIEANDTLKINGSVKQVKGKNLLSFKTSNLKASIFPISFELGLRWDPIDVSGHYHIDGHLLNIIPIYGNGPFKGEFEGVFAYGRVDIGTKSGRLYVKKMDINFGLKDIKVKMDNFLGSTLGDIICEIINENLPTWIEQFKIGYLPAIKDGIVKEINEFLKDKSLDELLELIQGFFTTTSAAPSSTTPIPIL